MKVRLGDVIKIESSSKKTVGDKFWLLNLDMVEQQTGRVIAYNYVPREALNGSIIQFDADCVLYSKLRPNLNKVVLPKEGGYATSEMLPLKPDTRVLSKEYLAIFLRSSAFVKWAESKTAGAKMPRLGTQVFLNKEITIPSLPEQEQIANQFAKLDEIVNLRKEQLAKLDELVKSRFVEMFGSTKKNHRGYPIVKIGSCAKLQGGFAFKSSDYLDEGVRLVQISNVNKDTLDWNNRNCVPRSFLQKYSDFELQVGDLVLAMTRPVIKSLEAVKIATVAEDDVPSLLNQRVGRFVFDKTRLTSAYLMVSCQMLEFREYVEAMSGNSLQPNISSKQVEDYSIVLPPLEQQQQFATFVAQVDKSKLAVKKSLEELEILKKSLMQKYFG